MHFLSAVHFSSVSHFALNSFARIQCHVPSQHRRVSSDRGRRRGVAGCVRPPSLELLPTGDAAAGRSWNHCSQLSVPPPAPPLQSVHRPPLGVTSPTVKDVAVPAAPGAAGARRGADTITEPRRLGPCLPPGPAASSARCGRRRSCPQFQQKPTRLY